MTAEQMTQLDDAATQEAIHRVAGWAAAHYQELPDIADIQFAVRGAIAWRIELIALRARVGELSEDKARLDFMREHFAKFCHHTRSLKNGIWTQGMAIRWRVVRGPNKGADQVTGIEFNEPVTLDRLKPREEVWRLVIDKAALDAAREEIQK